MNTTYKIVEQLDGQTLKSYYRQMVLIRVFEERAGEQYMLGKIRGFLHLYIGEEAIAVGAIASLKPQDYVATHYRDHGHALARGLEPGRVMAELFGKATGTTGGVGGSMHLFDKSRNFVGGYAIVGGQLPIATGLALASSYKQEDRVTLCFLGDGALQEGEFHESMNMASLWKLPVIFFCENNLYGMGVPVGESLAKKDIYKMAEAYDVPSVQIDGMDVLAVREATQGVADHVRSGNGPYFIEAKTYRFRGHSVADPAEYRTKIEEQRWQMKDPIASYKEWLLDKRYATEAELAALDVSVEQEVEEAVQFADASPNPPPEALYRNVYAEQPGAGA
ncbi:MAG: pyruvate dehydrogenase (acetyl-transferring) E1 component subunit alpha [Chloroflexi bacterium]|nr:pyruvate dehydrogenase (acetyl-transferring) E1 component subunit alpha [Chloroflexota bacterium]